MVSFIYTDLQQFPLIVLDNGMALAIKQWTATNRYLSRLAAVLTLKQEPSGGKYYSEGYNEQPSKRLYILLPIF